MNQFISSGLLLQGVVAYIVVTEVFRVTAYTHSTATFFVFSQLFAVGSLYWHISEKDGGGVPENIMLSRHITIFFYLLSIAILLINFPLPGLSEFVSDEVIKHEKIAGFVSIVLEIIGVAMVQKGLSTSEQVPKKIQKLKTKNKRDVSRSSSPKHRVRVSTHRDHLLRGSVRPHHHYHYNDV